MKIEGAHDIPVPRQKVWEAFLDPEHLRQAIPGCEKLEALGNDEFRAVMKVGVAAVKGTFEGKVKLSEKNALTSYRMAVEGSGGPGFVRGETVVTLSDIDGGTRVAYSADVHVGGLRSEEHTSELQSLAYLVCRLLLEKKKKKEN